MVLEGGDPWGRGKEPTSRAPHPFSHPLLPSGYVDHISPLDPASAQALRAAGRRADGACALGEPSSWHERRELNMQSFNHMESVLRMWHVEE